MFNRLRQKRVAAVVLVGVLGLTSAAYAYWTTIGSGSGSGSTGTSEAVVVTQTSSISDLAPGSPAQAIDFKISNPASTRQFISEVTVSIARITKGGVAVAAADCGADDFTLVQPNAINTDLAAGDTAFAPSGATLAMKNLATNQDGCKNVTVELAYAAA